MILGVIDRILVAEPLTGRSLQSIDRGTVTGNRLPNIGFCGGTGYNRDLVSPGG
jgi:hypothetical protein